MVWLVKWTTKPSSDENVYTPEAPPFPQNFNKVVAKLGSNWITFMRCWPLALQRRAQETATVVVNQKWEKRKTPTGGESRSHPRLISEIKPTSQKSSSSTMKTTHWKIRTNDMPILLKREFNANLSIAHSIACSSAINSHIPQCAKKCDGDGGRLWIIFCMIYRFVNLRHSFYAAYVTPVYVQTNSSGIKLQ